MLPKIHWQKMLLEISGAQKVSLFNFFSTENDKFKNVSKQKKWTTAIK